MSNQSAPSTQRGWRIVIAIIVVLILLVLIIPGVRASMSSWLGLSVAPSEQMPASAVEIESVSPQTTAETTPTGALGITPSQSNPSPLQTQVSPEVLADFNQFLTQAGWEILAPTFLPEGYQFQSAFYDTNHNMLILTYLVTRSLPGSTDPSLTSSETITLLQSQKNDFVPMQIAPDTNVTDIQVNDLPAAYTVGGWDTEFVKDSTAPNGGKMVSSWRNDLPVKNLYWQAGDIYLALITADEEVSQQELMDMAASILR
jgi:hypothetical protein